MWAIFGPALTSQWGKLLKFHLRLRNGFETQTYFILRLGPHILFWGFGLVFYLRLRPHVLYWGFILVFYFEASSSHFILRLCPHILFWGFVLIFYFEALSSYFILRLRPHYFILRLCSSVWGFGPHCSRPLLLCLYCLFDLFAVICVWFCLLYFCLG